MDLDDSSCLHRFIRASCFVYERDDGERFWEAEAVALDVIDDMEKPY